MQREFSLPGAARAIGGVGSLRSPGTTGWPSARRGVGWGVGPGGRACKPPVCIGPGIYRVFVGDLLAPDGVGLAVLRAICRSDPHGRILVVTDGGSNIRSASDMREAIADFGRHRGPGFAAADRDRGPEPPPAQGNIDSDGQVRTSVERLVGMSLAEVERLLIEATIQACGASLPRAASVLGVSPSTLYRKRAAWADL